jgi:signal transduction histidine kinase
VQRLLPQKVPDRFIADVYTDDPPKQARLAREQVDHPIAEGWPPVHREHQACRAISANPLERDPLDVAIARICRNFEDDSGIALRVEARSLPALSAPTTTHVVNVVREALTNAMRHAGARSIRVETSAEPTAVIIAVEDDGCGFVPDLNISGHGLRGMRSRAAAIGASLEIRSVPGSGSVVRMRLPIAHSGATA